MALDQSALLELAEMVQRADGGDLMRKLLETMLQALVVGDPSDRLTQTWMVAQELRLLHRRSHDLVDARHRLWRVLDRCARSDVRELLRLARTLDAWQGELLATFTPTGKRGVSNGSTEAVNALIKKIKKIRHGFRNLGNYRLRLLLATGVDWRTGTWQAALPPPSEDAHHAWWGRADIGDGDGGGGRDTSATATGPAAR